MRAPNLNQVSRLAILIIASLVGCNQTVTPTPVRVLDGPQATTSGNTSSSAPTLRTPSLSPSPARVALSECHGKAIDNETYRLSFKYRFIGGSPNSASEYSANVMFDGFYESKAIAGSALQNSGEFQWDYKVPNVALLKNRKLEKFKLTLFEVVGNEDGRTWSSGISDETDGVIDDN